MTMSILAAKLKMLNKAEHVPWMWLKRSAVYRLMNNITWNIFRFIQVCRQLCNWKARIAPLFYEILNTI